MQAARLSYIRFDIENRKNLIRCVFLQSTKIGPNV